MNNSHNYPKHENAIVSTIVILEGRGQQMSVTGTKVKENETIDSALRRFKRSCIRAGIMSDYRKKEHYEKPSVRRKKKAEAARKRKFKR